MTLLELLMVISLVSLLLGAGAGALASFDVGHRAARGLVQNVVRTAANSSLARDAPAVVRIDRIERTAVARALQVVGTWHFESAELEGAFGLDGELYEAELVDDGWLGQALSFVHAAGPNWAEFPVESDPAFDLAEGFALECSVRIEARGGAGLIDVGGVAGLELTPDGALVAWLVPAVTDEFERASRGARIGVESRPGVLGLGGWRRVRASYDRTRFELEVDGTLVAALPYDAPVWKLDGPLTAGDTRRVFPGSIDALAISAVVATESVPLPEGVEFGAGTTTLIRFTAGGHLDRRLHAGPAQVELVYEDGQEDTIRVGLYGTVE